MEEEIARDVNDESIMDMEDSALAEVLDAEEQPDAGTVKDEPEDATVTGTGAEPPVTVESLKTEIETLKQESEKYQKQIRDGQVFINRQANELGDLRKIKEKLLERKKELSGQDASQQIIDGTFRHAQTEERDIDRQLDTIEQEERAVQTKEILAANRRNVLRYYPDIESNENLEAICREARESGESPENIQRFRQAPYMMNPGVILYYYSRAKHKTEVAELKKQIEELKGQPAKLMAKVANAGRRSLTNTAGGTAKKNLDAGDLTDVDISALSDSDLKKLLEEDRR